MSRDALVVGINTYERLSSLKSPSEDAEAIAQLLTRYGDFKVRRLPAVKKDDSIRLGQKTKVTLTQLEEALVQLFKPEGKHIPDTALLYFSGHGLRKERGIQEGFLATSDVNPDLGNWGVRLKWLRELLQESPIRQQIIWLDCCYSGELLNFAEADPGDRGKGRDRCFIAASREFEVAYESVSGNYSVMTQALLQGLDPKQQLDGLVTNYTLIDFLNQTLKSATQRPLYANSGGEIILTGRGAEASSFVLDGICPYKGLAYFDCNDEDPKYFYGRTALTDQLLEKVRQGNLLAVLGASGSGKSSVVRAGLIHQLKLGQRLSGSNGWQIYIFRPGEHPLARLAETFVESGLSAVDRTTQLAKAEELIEAGTVGLGQLVTATEAARVVLVVDQFEEAFTLCQDSTERHQFFDCLLGAVEREDNKLCLVLTMRADFFGKCAEHEYAGLANKIQEHLVTVTPMNQQELEQAITEPAKQVGLEVERELIAEMIANVEGSPGSLPLLQYTLTELWKQRTVNRLTLSAYTRLGGVKGTLQKRANEVYESLLPEEQLTAKRIFLELTQLGEGTEDTRRQVVQQDLVSSQQSVTLVDKVIRKLADAKLVVTSSLSEKGAKSGRVAVVDVAHEALIRHWSLLRRWVNENRDALRQKRNIEEDAQEWLNKGKVVDYLLQGLKLTEAENFLQRYAATVSLSSFAQEFVQKSSQQQRNRRRRTISSLAGVIALLTALSGFALFNWAATEKGKVIAELNALSLSSEKLFASDQFEALIESLKAGRQLKKSGAEADIKVRVIAALHQVVYSLRERRRWEGASDEIESVSFSPDGKTIASASFDGTIKLWNTNGQQLTTLKGHTKVVTSVSFSPDGKIIASASFDGTIKLWNTDGRELITIKGHSVEVTGVSFSPNGKIIASASSDKTIKLWSIAGQKLGTLKEYGSGDKWVGSNSVSFSPDGKTIAAAGDDSTVKLWSLDGKELATLRGHTDQVASVSFSPDGKTIASAGYDKTIRLWSSDGKEVGLLGEHRAPVMNVSFSPDGQTLASAGWDKTIKLWSFDGREPVTLSGHRSFVTSVSFSPDGQTLASVSWDKTIKLWSLDDQKLSTLKGHSTAVVSFSPDGKTLVLGSLEGTSKLWNTRSHKFIALKGHTAEVTSVSFSPDGKTIASASRDRTIKLWNIDGQQLATLQEAIGKDNIYVGSFSFSPDGKTIASASEGGVIKLWSVHGKELATLKDGGYVTSVSFSPDGKTIASASAGGIIKLWSVHGKKLTTLKGHSNNNDVPSLRFSPDGQTLASANIDNTIKLWSIAGKELAVFKGHNHGINSISFSPDGKTLASASHDSTIKLWNLNGEELATFKGQGSEVKSISFSPDGKTLASAESNGTVILWNLDLDDLLARGCDWVNDYLNDPNANLTNAERHLCDGVQASAQLLVEQGRALAEKGDAEGAVAKFQKAKELDTSLNFDPEAEARRSSALSLIVKGESLVEKGKLREAIVAYIEAQKLDPTLEVAADSWNSLCWGGSLHGYAKDVIFACEKAVVLASEHGNIRDSRGLARALTGDKKGALEDFQAFIKETEDEKAKAQRQRWIAALRAGENPFTPEEIKRLLNQ